MCYDLAHSVLDCPLPPPEALANISPVREEHLGGRNNGERLQELFNPKRRSDRKHRFHNACHPFLSSRRDNTVSQSVPNTRLRQKYKKRGNGQKPSLNTFLTGRTISRIRRSSTDLTKKCRPILTLDRQVTKQRLLSCLLLPNFNMSRLTFRELRHRRYVIMRSFHVMQTHPRWLDVPNQHIFAKCRVKYLPPRYISRNDFLIPEPC